MPEPNQSPHDRRKGPAIASSARPNTIGVHSRELAALLDSIDLTSGDSQADKRRQFVRWPFRRAAITVKLAHPGGNTVALTMACRNLSCGGVSLLHNAFAHTGSRCICTLPHRHGPVEVAGVIVRCTHRRGVIHELGVKFDKPIEAREFVTVDPFASSSLAREHVDPTSLSGTLLHVDDSPLDIKLIAHFLKGTGLRIRQTTEPERALEIARQGVDIVMCDVEVRGTGAAFARELRAAGVTVPLVAVLGDDGIETRSAAFEMQACAFLSKPLTADVIIRALGEHLRRPAARGTAAGPGSAPPGLESQQFREFCSKLRAAVGASDAAACKAVCTAIRGTAPMYGNQPLAQLASQAVECLGRGAAFADSRPTLDALLRSLDSLSKAA